MKLHPSALSSLPNSTAPAVEEAPLSAVAATGAPIKFIGTGEKIEDIESFVPSRFVGRLLGMGDLETLLEKVHDAEIKVPPKKAKEIMSGNFTLTDMYEQFAAVKNMGPFSKVMKMIPGLSGYQTYLTTC